jgi:predicted RNase H-like HicB family nuclease
MLDYIIPINTNKNSPIDTAGALPQVTLRSGHVMVYELGAGNENCVPILRKAIPEILFRRYIEGVMTMARVESEDSKWFAEIPGFTGVWGEGDTQEQALEDLKDGLDDWLILKIEDEDRDLPVIAGIDLNVI